MDVKVPEDKVMLGNSRRGILRPFRVLSKRLNKDYEKIGTLLDQKIKDAKSNQVTGAIFKLNPDEYKAIMAAEAAKALAIV